MLVVLNDFDYHRIFFAQLQQKLIITETDNRKSGYPFLITKLFMPTSPS